MKTLYSPLGGRLLKVLAYFCFSVSVLAACSSDVGTTNPTESTAKLAPAKATELSTGISTDTLSTNFGQPQSSANIAAMSVELKHFFAKQRNDSSSAKLLNSETVVANTQSFNLTGTPKPIYRFYNSASGAHFFTASDVEKNYVQSNLASFNLEGEAFYGVQSTETGLTPIYRFYNRVNGAHFFTADATEKDSVIANLSSIYNYEGEAWYVRTVATSGWTPVYRMYNSTVGAHFYTSSDSERASIIANLPQFSDEGIAFYALPSKLAISGIAATGAPFPSGSKIEIIDKTGATVGQTIILNAEGSYNIIVSAGAQAPLVIKASADGASTMYSVSPTLVAGTVNVTPITNLIAARLSPTGNPSNLAAEVQAGTATVSVAETTAKTQEIMTALSPLTTAVGDTTDPLTGAFTANGTGHDKLLDSLKIKITPTLTAGVQSSNIDVTVVTLQADTAMPIVIPTFSATAATIPPLSVATIPAATLVADGTATKIRDLVAQMQTCYGLTLNERVAPSGTTPSDVIAPECRTLFAGNDPATYKQNGFKVSSTSQYSGIFKDSSTGTLFDLGNYEFPRSNGDIVFTFRTRSADGLNSNYNTSVARLEGTQLKLIGNQWNYDASIKPEVSQRIFPYDLTYDHQTTGYNIFVANKVVGGIAIFNKVVVTSPLGTAYTLKPSDGYSYLVLEKSPGVLTNSNLVRLNGNPLGTQTMTQIATKETGGYWSDFSYWTEAQISNLTQNGKWKYEYYLTTNASTTPDSTEYRTTYERAPTLAELRSITFAKFKDDFVADLTAKSANTTGGYITMQAPTATIALSWDVPFGALAPINGYVFGRAPYISAANLGNRFDDTIIFGSASRTASVSCSNQSAVDLHCDAQSNFATGTRYNFLQLRAVTPRFMDVFSQLGLYKPSLN